MSIKTGLCQEKHLEHLALFFITQVLIILSGAIYRLQRTFSILSDRMFTLSCDMSFNIQGYIIMSVEYRIKNISYQDIFKADKESPYRFFLDFLRVEMMRTTASFFAVEQKNVYGEWSEPISVVMYKNSLLGAEFLSVAERKFMTETLRVDKHYKRLIDDFFSNRCLPQDTNLIH